MRVSITDVAKKAQVSIATVSRVINQNDYVAPETRKIVEAAIKKTGYHLPQHHLANHTKNKIIEVILPSVTNPLYAKFYQEIERNLAAENYSSLLKIAQKVLSLGKKNILILSGNRADLYPLNDRLKGMLSVFNHYKVNVKTTYIDFESSMMVKKIQIAKLSTHQNLMQFVVLMTLLLY